jgi:LmbE family N-acetylglucosaminyl deacetylase
MSHVFVAPHPDDVALACGGLIGSLRELGQHVTIITLYSGAGAGDGLSAYQREALGFGSKALWPASEAFNRSNLRAEASLERMGREKLKRVIDSNLIGVVRGRLSGGCRRQAAGNDRAGTAAHRSITSRWPASSSSTTCRPGP